MLYQYHEQVLPNLSVAFIVISQNRALAYALSTLVFAVMFWYLLASLPVSSWFRKPIESAGECPHCGSKDFRPAPKTIMEWSSTLVSPSFIACSLRNR